MIKPSDDLLIAVEALRGDLASLRQELAGVAVATREIRSLVGPVGVPLPDGTMLVQTIHGVKYCIDPMDMIIAPNLIVYRQWEADLTALLLGAAKSDTVFIDIGANFGYFTCLLGSRIGRAGNGRVYSVEPNPDMVALLRRNCAINWSMCPIEIFDCAVGAQGGEAKLIVPTNRASNASLCPNAVDNRIDGRRINVKVQPIDALIPDGVRVDLMKIDVEGHELSVLLGAKRVISQSQEIIVILEWSPDQTKSAGYSSRKLINLIRELELHPYKMQDRFGNISSSPIGIDEMETMGYGNIVLMKNQSR